VEAALILSILAALALGLACAKLLRDRGRLESERARLASERDVAVARNGDESRMKESFEALAARQLASATEQLVALANAKLGASQADGRAELERRRAEIEKLVQPLQRALEDANKLYLTLGGDQKSLTGELKQFAGAHELLRAETRRLSDALARPTVRGRYGEIQLRRVLELAGMLEWCDFTEQSTVRDDAGARQRPDLLVRLPNERVVAIDSKLNLDEYQRAIEEGDPELQRERLASHGRVVAEQARLLGRKEYWSKLGLTTPPEFVVMFVPGDQVLDAALQGEPRLIDIAAASNVVLASPSTLIGLLRAIHVGWRERKLTENAEELRRLGQQLLDRAGSAFEHVGTVGEKLNQAVRAYNALTGSIETRLMPTLRRFEEGKRADAKELAPPAGVDALANPYVVPHPEPDALPARNDGGS
jgi:DNA recombination protein RmuC